MPRSTRRCTERRKKQVTEGQMQAPEPRYRYAGLPLTPAIAEELIRERFSGQVVARQTIVEEVDRVHLSRGGKRAEVVDLSSMMKKALGNLRDNGFAENPSVGYWRIGPDSDDPEVAAVEGEQLIDVVADETPPAADLVLADGADEKSAVYLYYLPTYRLQAESEKAAVWPCKVGRTDRDPLSRILAQAATALPEKPHVALVVFTKYPVALETAIHGVLTLRGKRVDNSPGKEWFLTCPDEVRELIEFFDPRLRPA